MYSARDIVAKIPFAKNYEHNVTISRSEIERFHTLDNLPSRSLFEEFALSYDRLCPCAFQYRDFDHDSDPGRDGMKATREKRRKTARIPSVWSLTIAIYPFLLNA